jgi:hypothetical protein
MTKLNAQVGRDGISHARDSAPPGSILNANISGFWLTMDLLDVDNTTPAVSEHESRVEKTRVE